MTVFRSIIVGLCLAGFTGCVPPGQSRSDEEKEPHFIAGRNCVNAMDYQGAIEEFELALKVNPDSAAAHFQLGWLYEQKASDPAAAIYHYEQFLKRRLDYSNPQTIREHITSCKQDLAKTVLPLPVTPDMQRQFEQLAEENKALREELEKWQAYAKRLQAFTNAAPPPVAARLPGPGGPSVAAGTAAPGVAAPGAGTNRVYVVQAGDAPYSIARKHNVKLEALLAANPGVDPRRLRIGQTLIVPAP